MASYVLERRVGEGGMAEVYLARAEGPMGFSRVCAVKRLLPSFTRDPQVQRRFIDEARIAASLRHPCIVEVFDFYEENGVHHLVMEYVEGRATSALIHAALGGDFVPCHLTARIIADVSRALTHAHEHGVLHRDVSSSNVLVSLEGEVKLVDFGIADAAERLSSTEPGAVAGKAGYLSPARLRGERARPEDDLYALGILLDRLLWAAHPRDRIRETGKRLTALQARLVTPTGSKISQAVDVLSELQSCGLPDVIELRNWIRRPRIKRIPKEPRTPLPANIFDGTTVSAPIKTYTTRPADPSDVETQLDVTIPDATPLAHLMDEPPASAPPTGPRRPRR